MKMEEWKQNWIEWLAGEANHNLMKDYAGKWDFACVNSAQQKGIQP